MIDSNALVNELIAEIKKDIELSTNLLGLLHAEKAGLEAKNLALLESIIAQKSAIIAAININQLARDKIQQQLGGSTGFNGLKEILDRLQLKQHPVFKEILKELELLLIKIKNLAEINGKIVAISQAQTARVIDIIYGRENQTYSGNAKVYSTGTSTTLIKA